MSNQDRLASNRFGDFIRQRRKVLNMSQKELADKTEELSEDTLGRLERGENLPSFRTLRLLAKALSVEVEALAWLAYGDDPSAGPTSVPPTSVPPTSVPPTPVPPENVEVVVYNHDDELAWRGTGTPDSPFLELLTLIREQTRVELPARDHYFFVVDGDRPERMWRLDQTLGECMASHGNPDRLKFNLLCYSQPRRG